MANPGTPKPLAAVLLALILAAISFASGEKRDADQEQSAAVETFATTNP